MQSGLPAEWVGSRLRIAIALTVSVGIGIGMVLDMTLAVAVPGVCCGCSSGHPAIAEARISPHTYIYVDMQLHLYLLGHSKLHPPQPLSLQLGHLLPSLDGRIARSFLTLNLTLTNARVLDTIITSH